MSELFFDGRIDLRCGDSREVLRQFPDNHFHSIVTDPPYALVSIVKRFANSPRNERTENTENPYGRTGRGFMGQRWDVGDTAFAAEFWAECLRILKPGGHVVAFGGTRTYHRLACAIEDAGFEIRDMLSWLYGSGFPKSHDVAKGMRRELAGPSIVAEWDGWGTALKPALEPICFGRKPIDGTVAQNARAHGTGALNVDACRIHADDAKGYEYTATRMMPGAGQNKTGERKQEGVSFTGKTKDGRWPANVIHDGSEEVVEAFPESDGVVGALHDPNGSLGYHGGAQGAYRKGTPDSGSAARFFYAAKADAADRIGSKHPTVKPVDLMQWLVRLVTPKGGLVLDPFAGTGTTAEAALREGMRCVVVERESAYQADIRRRMALCMAGPEERAREGIKAKLADKPMDAGPLFAALK